MSRSTLNKTAIATLPTLIMREKPIPKHSSMAPLIGKIMKKKIISDGMILPKELLDLEDSDSKSRVNLMI